METLRQAAVFASGVLAIERSGALRAIVGKVTDLLGTPMAAISIVDRYRQWFPVAIGLPAETPREWSFCAYTILTPERTFCVPDARIDARFADNPLVTGEPAIRFYAGAPIVDHGLALGALCAIDRVPRACLSAGERAAFRRLAHQAMLEIRQTAACRDFGAEAIEHIVVQMRQAAHSDDEPTLLALDRLVQLLEREIERALPVRAIAR